MPDFSQRSYKKELLDGDDIPFPDIEQNMRELEFINTHLGGHAISIRGLKEFLRNNPPPFFICEIGCGGGDNLKAIYHWCRKKKISVGLSGIDINADCIAFARKNCSEIPGINFIVSDYQLVDFPDQKPAIIFSSLFCHHLNDGQFREMLGWCSKQSSRGFFINDLQRHPLAYYAIKLLTRLFSKSYLVKNDAPLSVERGFSKTELTLLLKESGLRQFRIYWKWAFRWLVIVKH